MKIRGKIVRAFVAFIKQSEKGKKSVNTQLEKIPVNQRAAKSLTSAGNYTQLENPFKSFERSEKGENPSTSSYTQIENPF